MCSADGVQLELTLDDIRTAIIAAKLPSLEVRSHRGPLALGQLRPAQTVGIGREKQRLRVFPKQGYGATDLLDRKANKPYDDFTRLHTLARALPDVVIKVCAPK
jgi:hypothetical protein